MKNNTASDIAELFIDSKLEASIGSDITMKNMLYLWKSFLDEKTILERENQLESLKARIC